VLRLDLTLATPWRVTVAVGVGVGLVAWLVATPAVALASAALVVAAGTVPQGRALLVAGAPVALIVSRADVRPAAAWLALALLAGEMLLSGWRARSSAPGQP
jgi:hypothetical protein